MKLFISFAVLALLGSTMAVNFGTAQTETTCTGVAVATDLTTNCNVVEASGKTQKCCLLTFTTVAKYQASSPTDIAGDTAGGQADGKKFCYKKGGNFRFKVASGGAAADMAGDQFCKKTAVDAKPSYHAGAATDGTGTKNVKGTASACSCTISTSIFTLGFSLLAILASLWK